MTTHISPIEVRLQYAQKSDFISPIGLIGLILVAAVVLFSGALRVEAAIFDVSITSAGFSPSTLNVAAGDTVRWTNNDIVTHNVSSNDHPTHTLYPFLNLGDIAPGGTVSVSFASAGTYGYHDHLFPLHLGSVSVMASSVAAGVPNAPTSLTATASSATQVNLSWTDNSTNEDGFKIYRKLTSDINITAWSVIANVAVSIISYSDSTVMANTGYTYHVNAYNLSGVSLNSNWVSVTTPAAGTTDTIPPAAITLSLGSVTSSTASFSWAVPGDDDFAGTVTSYELRFSTTVPGTDLSMWWSSASLYSCATHLVPAPIAPGPGVKQSMTAGCLAASTSYYFGMRAKDEVPNISALTSTLLAATASGTTGDTTAPSAVSNIFVKTFTHDSATLEWTSPGDDGTTGTAMEYDIRYTSMAPPAAMTTADLEIWWSGMTMAAGEPLPMVAGSIQSFIVSGLLSNSTYYFAMKTRDEVPNWSGLSNSVSVTTLTAPAADSATLSGKVKKSDGTGVADAWVYVWTSSGTYNSYSAQSDATGNYKITGIVPATYQATVYPPFESGLSAPPEVSLSFTKGESKLYDFTLISPAKTISGKVSFASGAAVTDASISVWRECPAGSSTCPGGGAWTNVDASGNYSVKVTGGSWRVSVYPKDYLTATWTWMGEAVLVSFLIDESLETKTVNFTVESTAGYGSLSGRVLNGTGKAISGAWISVWSDQTNQTDQSYYSATSASDGTYRIDNIKPGTYKAVAYPPSGATDLMQSAEVTLSFVDKEAKIYDFKLTTGAKTISGSVKDSAGKAITDATVSAYKDGGYGWAQSDVKADGTYLLKVTGGKWSVSVYPKDSLTAKWTWNKEPLSVTFADDQTVESRTVDFVVTTVNAVVKGKIAMPDGTAPAMDTVGVNLKGSAGAWYGGGRLAADGSFSINASAGTYTLEIYAQDQSLYAPPIAAFSVIDGQILDLGTIKLIKKAEKIVGKVTDGSGAAVTGANVSAWLKDTTVAGGYAWTTTGTTGTYELFVFPGTWSVSVYAHDPTGKQQYANLPPKDVIVGQGATVTLDFVLQKTDAIISGTVTDCCGNLLADASGWVDASSAAGFGAGSSWFGGEIRNGKFSFNVTPGTWTLSVYFQPGSKYLGADPVTVTVESGKTAQATIKALTANAVIEGFAKNTSGTIVKNVNVSVYASCIAAGAQCVWTSTNVDPATGFYKLNVSAGTWSIGYWVQDSASGWVAKSVENVEVIIKSGETKRLDIVLLKADAKITGKATKPDGTPVAQAWVGADTWSSRADITISGGFTSTVSYGGQTDHLGNFSINVPAGTYYVHASAGYLADLIPPDEQQVTLISGETKTVNLLFKTPDAVIKGRTLKDGKDPVKAWVWAWSDTGTGGASRESDSLGNYELKVAAGTWHVGAGAQIGNEYYNSVEKTIAVASGETKTLDLSLLSVAFVPPPTTQTTCATCATSLSLENGATCTVPPNAAGTSGNITVSFQPDASLPTSSGTYSVMGVGYEVVVRDDAGNIVSSLNSAATVCLPFDTEDLKGRGIDPARLKLAWYDNIAGAWKTLDEQVIDPENGKVCGSITHLTRFAIVAPADVTPPSAPASVAANAGSGSVALSWVNPAADFHSARIYRSTAAGQLGALVASNIKDTSYADSGLQNGVAYYYTVRAIDLAGNESVNVAQVSATPGAAVVVATAAAPTGQLPSGSLFRIKDQMTVWFAEKGIRRGIPSLAVFEANGFSWSDVKVIDSASHLDLYAQGRAERFPEGAVLKGSAPAVYVVTDRNKLAFSSAEVFLGLGYSWDEILTVSDDELALHDTGAEIASTSLHPNGSLVKLESDPTVWFIRAGERRGIPSLAVFDSRRFRWSAVRTISSGEMTLYPTGSVLTPANFTLVKADAPEVFFMEDGKKRYIASAEAFIAKGFDWGKIVQFAQQVIDLIPEGLSIR